ncbi:hypothetical protein AYL99_09304 [Fonsecaea erecta]|uniref:Uncharacterized protein n=1 Tax=Fonsecaea erecta TaxID=1367422 RepID=A0A178ZAL0_9EURO|nr:hypothetical protein AYL99_09304 [Fonsecaea erecta]OAP56125.1 hypothetical protein AYL99_09304 [Fonsecaea erecta]
MGTRSDYSKVPHQDQVDSLSTTPSTENYKPSGTASVDAHEAVAVAVVGHRHSSSKWSQLRNDYWFDEVASLILGIVAIGAICAVLATYDGQPAPRLPHGITLNAIVSFLATIAKACLLVPLASVIGQGKWLWFLNSHKLGDIQTLDAASRGPMGAVQMLTTRRGGFLASISAAAVLLSVGFDAFVQQLITYPLRQTSQQSDLARIRTMVNQSTSSINFLDLPFWSAVQSGIYDGQSSPRSVPSCPQGSCEWPVYHSLAFCSKCVNMTDHVTMTTEPGSLVPLNASRIIEQYVPYISAYTLATDGNQSVVVLRNQSVQFPNGVPGQVIFSVDVDGPAIYNENGTAEIPNSCGLDMNYTTGLVWPLNIPDPAQLDLFELGPNTWLGGTYAGIKNPLLALGSISMYWNTDGTQVELKSASECALTLCVNEYQTKVNGTTVTSSILSTTYGEVQAHSGLGYATWSAEVNGTTYFLGDGINFAPNDPNGAGQDGEQLTGIIQTMLDVTVGNKYYMGHLDCTVDQDNATNRTVVTECYAEDEFDGTVYSSTEMQIIDTTPRGVEAMLENIAAATTDLFQRYGNVDVTGSAVGAENFVQTRWWWISLPAAVVVMAMVSLAATMYSTKRRGIGIWKTALLPMVFRGPFVEDGMRGGGVGGGEGKIAGGHDLGGDGERLSTMKSAAEVVNVELPHDSPILYLIRHGEKPPKEADGDDSPGLSAQGITRAQGLVQVFGHDSPYNIGYIIAQKPKSDGRQTRPYLTVSPLAQSLQQYNVPFNYTIERDHVGKVADAVHDYIKGKGDYIGKGNVLICWEHETLEKVAAAIGVQDVPDYPGKRFDIIWTIKAPYDKIDSITSEDVPGLDNHSATPS